MKLLPAPGKQGLKFDLHLHSQFSGDSLIHIDKISKFAKKKGLNGLAITDHNSLKGYQILKKNSPDLLIIPGMEIKTDIGEIIGLFISEEIDVKGNNYLDIIDDIKEKNGIVVVPHPFDKFRKSRLDFYSLSEEIIKKTIQGMEIMNSRIILKKHVKEAIKCQKKYNFFKTGGSDAHTLPEIGNAYTFIPVKDEQISITEDELKKNLLAKNSESFGRLSSPFVHAITVSYKIKKKIFK